MTEHFSSREHDAFHVPHLSDTIPEAAFNGQAVKTVAYLRVSTPQQDASKPAPRHPGVRAEARSPHRRLHRGDRLRTGFREAPPAGRADERPAARRPSGRQRTLPVRPVAGSGRRRARLPPATGSRAWTPGTPTDGQRKSKAPPNRTTSCPRTSPCSSASGFDRDRPGTGCCGRGRNPRAERGRGTDQRRLPRPSGPRCCATLAPPRGSGAVKSES